MDETPLIQQYVQLRREFMGYLYAMTRVKCQWSRGNRYDGAGWSTTDTALDPYQFFQASRTHQCNCRGIPALPRCWVPTCITRPVSLTTLQTCWPFSMINVIGFSQHTSLPARMASIAILTCQ